MTTDTLRDEFEAWQESKRQSEHFSIRASAEDAWEAYQAGRAAAEADRLDAKRYRELRNVPDDQLNVAGIPCIAIPEGPHSGDFVNGDDADAAIDAAISQKENGRD